MSRLVRSVGTLAATCGACCQTTLIVDQARLLFEHMLGYASHLGLYAEEIGPRGEALGNFPQAFTHLALISAAFNLDRALGSRELVSRRFVP